MRLTLDQAPFELHLKLTPLADFMLGAAGLDVQKATAALYGIGGKYVAVVMQTFTALVAHQYAAIHEPVPTAEQWAAYISEQPNPREAWRCVLLAVRDALAAGRDNPAKTETIN